MSLAADDTDLGALLEVAFRRSITDHQWPIHARVTAYDAAKQRADVQPLLSLVLPGGEVVAPQIQQGMAVAWIGSGGYSITWPLAVGDIVQILPGEQDLAAWLMSGSTEPPPTPERASLNTAVAVPLAARPQTGLIPSTGYAADAMVIAALKLLLGDSAATPVALASLVDARITALQQAFDAHQHPETGGTTGAPTAVLGPQDSTAATKVHAT